MFHCLHSLRWLGRILNFLINGLAWVNTTKSYHPKTLASIGLDVLPISPIS